MSGLTRRNDEMVNPFLMREDGRTEPLPRIRCAKECDELQAVLDENPDLLPGDQIDPDDLFPTRPREPAGGAWTSCSSIRMRFRRIEASAQPASLQQTCRILAHGRRPQRGHRTPAASGSMAQPQDGDGLDRMPR